MLCGISSVFDSHSINQTTLSSLPHEVLVQILQHVDQKQLLCSCASVSTRFRSAAVAACSSIQLRTDRIAKLRSLMNWLHKHGAAVTSLDLEPQMSPPVFLLESLPCSQLRSLHLDNAVVLLTASSSAAPWQQGLLHSCRTLTSLRLHGCTVLDTTENLAALSSLSDLQEIAVTSDPPAAQGPQHSPASVTMLPGSLLSQLLQLRCIVTDTYTVFSSIQHIGCLTLLQHLDLMLHASTQCEELAGLQRLQNLTFLDLGSTEPNSLSISATTTPGFAHLTALKVLSLHRQLSFDPTLLEGMVGLQWLWLHAVELAGGAAGTSALLAVLPAISHLTFLELNSSLRDCAPQQAEYTALGALTQLVTLRLITCVIPEGLWQQLVAAGLCMSSMTGLVLYHVNGWDTCLDAADLAALVSCFPQLCSLDCTAATKPGTEFSPLLGFRCLTYLGLDNVGDVDVPVLTRFQGLQQLRVPASRITDLGLFQLTALTALTQLDVTGGLSTAVSDYGGLPAAGTVSIRNQAPTLLDPRTPHNSDIPHQLLQRCISSPACQPYLLHEFLGQRLELARLRNLVAQHEPCLAQPTACLKDMTLTSNQDPTSAAVLHLSTAVAAGDDGSGAACSAGLPSAEGPASAQQ